MYICLYGATVSCKVWPPHHSLNQFSESQKISLYKSSQISYYNYHNQKKLLFWSQTFSFPQRKNYQNWYMISNQQQDAYKFLNLLWELVIDTLEPEKRSDLKEKIAGKMKTSTICHNCNKVKSKLEPFSEISLVMMTQKMTSQWVNEWFSWDHDDWKNYPNYHDPIMTQKITKMTS